MAWLEADGGGLGFQIAYRQVAAALAGAAAFEQVVGEKIEVSAAAALH
ncbi:hypothetical protein LP420_37705 [Massilia sp. B-10]|nr:hypothetical protein LP420_37705 [Massilia sp. B-10]